MIDNLNNITTEHINHYNISCQDIYYEAQGLVTQLKDHEFTLALAESCTGGTIAQYVTSVAGCSEVFYGSLVCYQALAKQKILGISYADIQSQGIVSLYTATQMALSTLDQCQTTVACGVTGYAGPGGGDEIEPEGSVYITYALRLSNNKVKLFNHHLLFNGINQRKFVRKCTTLKLLQTVRKILENDYYLFHNKLDEALTITATYRSELD